MKLTKWKSVEFWKQMLIEKMAIRIPSTIIQEQTILPCAIAIRLRSVTYLPKRKIVHISFFSVNVFLAINEEGESISVYITDMAVDVLSSTITVFGCFDLLKCPDFSNGFSIRLDGIGSIIH